jgi:phenylalanine-4-hydroxylase
MDMLRLSQSGIPHFGRLSERLEKATGWTVVAVPDLVPDEVFFEHLANRRFPASDFIRRADQLDYIQEPDIFHDVFGHVPMLAHPVFADYMEAYGKGGLRAAGKGVLHNLARLYWYTVEFGLVNTAEGLRIYGSGIVSSKTESVFCLEDASPNRIHFELLRVMRSKYRIDDFQQVYFVIDSFEELFEATLQDFGPIYQQLKNMSDLEITDIPEADKVYTEGTQAYATKRAAETEGAA